MDGHLILLVLSPSMWLVITSGFTSPLFNRVRAWGKLNSFNSDDEFIPNRKVAIMGKAGESSGGMIKSYKWLLSFRFHFPARQQPNKRD